MSVNKKIGLLAVTSLVVGSQIGSGILLLPASLASFGGIGVSTWFITATGALLLAFVFARLCAKIPKTGGPHNYIEAAFGHTPAFFSAWTYWLISWISTTAVIIAIVGYLHPIFGNAEPQTNLMLELIILLFITILNILGVRTAAWMEFVFSSLKVLPLIIVPLAGLAFINMDHFVPFNPTGESPLTALNAAALLTLWGFIGVESATTPAGSVENASKTIPKAIIAGTSLVAIIYILNTFVIMGVIPPAHLSHSKAPFADAAAIIFGGNWYILISIAAAIVCLGTLNAWVLTSGQIALGAANDGHLPKIFKLKNKFNAPITSLLISSLGMVPFLILTLDVNLINQVNKIIDISVTAFLFVYVMSTLSYIKLFWKDPVRNAIDYRALIIGVSALVFCGWALWSSGLKTVGLALIITLTGVPIYLWRRKGQFIKKTKPA